MKATMTAVLLMAAAFQIWAQTTIYVAPGGDDNRDGTGGWTNAIRTISNGVALAVTAGDLVLVSNGTYDTTAAIQVSQPITLRGVDRDTTIIRGGYPSLLHQGLYINHSGATIEHFTITGCGSTNALGGGARLIGGALRDCMVVSNIARQGGGVYVSGNGLLADCQILDNVTSNSVSAGDGGGVYVNYCAGVTVSNCLIAGNIVKSASRYGGGVELYGGAPELVGCVISNNIAPNIGGGIYIAGMGSPRFDDCRIVGNTGGTYGGGVLVGVNCTALLTNCVVANNGFASGVTYGGGINSGSYGNTALTMLWCRVTGNMAGRFGAGIFMGNGLLDHCVITGNLLTNGTWLHGGGVYINSNAATELRNCLIAGNATATDSQGYGGGGLAISQNTTATVVNCTIADNYCYQKGGGVYFMFTNGADDRFFNCVIASNRVNDPALPTRNIYLLTAAHSNAFYWSCGDLLTNAAQGNITNDPQWVNLPAGDYRLRPGSPGVNAGSNQAWMAGAVDLDGRSRIDRFARQADMGCYEHTPAGSLIGIR